MNSIPIPPESPNEDDLSQLIASTPVIIGFNPAESIIMYMVTAHGDGSAVIRVDLPKTVDLFTDSSAELREMARQIAAAAVTNDATTAYAWVISTRPDAENQPFVAAVQDAFRYDGIPVAHVCWLASVETGATWRCQSHADCGGTLPDPRTVPAAVVAVAEGHPTFADRDELKRLLAPESDDRVADVAAQLARRSARIDRLQGWKLIIDALDAADESPNLPVLSANTVAALTSALEDPVLRDGYQHLALDSTAAVRLMTALTRSAPCPERATPAALLATHQYAAGDGARAQVAIDVALDADPNHGLAQVLRAVFNIGVPPEDLRAAVRDAIR